MSFDTRARHEADQARSTVRGVDPMAQLTELKREDTTRRRTAAVVAAVTVAVVVGATGWLAATQLGDSDDRTVVPAETPSAAVQPPSTGDVEPGRYSVPVIGSDLRAEVTVEGSGWSFDRWLGHPDVPSAYLLFHAVGSVPADACSLRKSFVRLPPGHSPDDLVAALDAQAPTSLSEPTAAVVGGYPAVQVELTVPRSAAEGGCVVWSDLDGFARTSGAGPNQLLVVDVDGTTVVVDPQADPSDAEVAQMIDSITFTAP